MIDLYFQPYGDDQQLNLNWIINEIINLHKQLDPDYETPSFTQVYPYSNLNRLNLDWILSELKALKELAPEPTPPLDIQAVAEALVALPFDTNTSYQIYDFISRDGEIWRATQAIAAGSEWDETKWFKTKLGTDLAVLERWINAINNSLSAEIEARQNADSEIRTQLNSVSNQFARRFPYTQVNDIADLATKTASMVSSEVGVFSGKSALGAALVGENASCTIIAKYIASSNYAVFLAFCSDANLNGGISYGVYKTVSPYDITIFETSLKTTGVATNVYEGSTVRVTKTWNNVQVSLTSDTTDRQFTSSGWKVLATLPEGYRPSNLVQGVPVRLSSGGVDVFKTGRITTSGDVGVFIGNNDINTNFRGINVFCTFII